MTTECSTSTSNGNGHAQVFELLAHALEEHITPKQALDEAAVRGLVEERLAQLRLPRPVEVKLPDQTTHQLDGLVHYGFDKAIKMVSEGHRNLMLAGPAGSGKTTLASNLAQALKLDFGFLSLSAGVTETHLFGRVLPQSDGSWQYQPSRFVEVYESGGVFLLDEMDAADANVMVAINAALANGVLANPNGKIHKRHPDTYIVGAANTWGRGGDTQYVGRNQLDASTLDRFVLATLRIHYDDRLEASLIGAMTPAPSADEPDYSGESAATPDQIIEWVAHVRRCIECYRLRRIASTRLVIHAFMAARAGASMREIKDRYFVDWSEDEKAKVQ